MDDVDDVVLVTDEGEECTRGEIAVCLGNVNRHMQNRYGNHYKVVFRYSRYWGQGKFFLKRRVLWFFWRYVRDGEHNSSVRKPWERTNAFNPQYFLEYVTPDLERRRLARLISVG